MSPQKVIVALALTLSFFSQAQELVKLQTDALATISALEQVYFTDNGEVRSELAAFNALTVDQRRAALKSTEDSLAALSQILMAQSNKLTVAEQNLQQQGWKSDLYQITIDAQYLSMLLASGHTGTSLKKLGVEFLESRALPKQMEPVGRTGTRQQREDKKARNQSRQARLLELQSSTPMRDQLKLSTRSGGIFWANLSVLLATELYHRFAAPLEVQVSVEAYKEIKGTIESTKAKLDKTVLVVGMMKKLVDLDEKAAEMAKTSVSLDKKVDETVKPTHPNL